MSAAPTRSDSLRIRTALLTEARSMLQAEGHPIALNALARRAGVGVGTVYRHFPSSQDLLEAVAFDALQSLRAEIREAAAEPDAWIGLERIVRAQVRMEVTHAGMREILATTAAHPDTEAAKAEMVGAVQSVLDRLRRAGRLHAAVTAADLRNILCGVGYTAGITPGRGEEVADLCVQIILRGLDATL